MSEICKALLANGLDKVIFHKRIGEDYWYYYDPNDDALEEQKINRSQLAECLENNISEMTRKDEWYYWNCFLPHLQAECPDIDLSDLAEATRDIKHSKLSKP